MAGEESQDTTNLDQMCGRAREGLIHLHLPVEAPKALLQPRKPVGRGESLRDGSWRFSRGGAFYPGLTGRLLGRLSPAVCPRIKTSLCLSALLAPYNPFY